MWWRRQIASCTVGAIDCHFSACLGRLGKTADKDDDRLKRFEALTSQQVQPESLRSAGGAKEQSGGSPEQLVDDDFGHGRGRGIDVVAESPGADGLVEVLAEADVGEFGPSPEVLFGEHCRVPVGSVRGEAFDDVSRWNSELGQREP